MAKPPTIYRWRIFRLIGISAKTLGYVEAPDAEAAIAKAIQNFKITSDPAPELIAERSRASWCPDQMPPTARAAGPFSTKA
jgi:hypothetical protein